MAIHHVNKNRHTITRHRRSCILTRLNPFLRQIDITRFGAPVALKSVMRLKDGILESVAPKKKNKTGSRFSSQVIRNNEFVVSNWVCSQTHFMSYLPISVYFRPSAYPGYLSNCMIHQKYTSLTWFFIGL